MLKTVTVVKYKIRLCTATGFMFDVEKYETALSWEGGSKWAEVNLTVEAVCTYMQLSPDALRYVTGEPQ